MMATNYSKARAPPNETQQAILNSIPQLSADDLESYSQLGSPNFLFPQGPSAGGQLQVFPHTLPAECNVDQRLPDHFGGVPAYSYVLRFTMIEDDDPYGQGIPTGTVGYWTHDGAGCLIDSQNQIHGIKWVGHSTSLAITEAQKWTVDLLLFGANCGWPTNWDAFYNGYVNVILNSVWDVNSPQNPVTMLRDTCGEWRKEGISNGPLGTISSWVVSNVMWSTVFSKIWSQSMNAGIRPTLKSNMLVDGNGRRALKILGKRLIVDFPNQIRLRSSPQLKPFDPNASVINRRLI